MLEVYFRSPTRHTTTIEKAEKKFRAKKIGKYRSMGVKKITKLLRDLTVSQNLSFLFLFFSSQSSETSGHFILSVCSLSVLLFSSSDRKKKRERERELNQERVSGLQVVTIGKYTDIQCFYVLVICGWFFHSGQGEVVRKRQHNLNVRREKDKYPSLVFMIIENLDGFGDSVVQLGEVLEQAHQFLEVHFQEHTSQFTGSILLVEVFSDVIVQFLSQEVVSIFFGHLEHFAFLDLQAVGQGVDLRGLTSLDGGSGSDTSLRMTSVGSLNKTSGSVDGVTTLRETGMTSTTGHVSVRKTTHGSGSTTRHVSHHGARSHHVSSSTSATMTTGVHEVLRNHSGNHTGHNNTSAHGVHLVVVLTEGVVLTGVVTFLGGVLSLGTSDESLDDQRVTSKFDFQSLGNSVFDTLFIFESDPTEVTDSDLVLGLSISTTLVSQSATPESGELVFEAFLEFFGSDFVTDVLDEDGFLVIFFTEFGLQTLELQFVFLGTSFLIFELMDFQNLRVDFNTLHGLESLLGIFSLLETDETESLVLFVTGFVSGDNNSTDDFTEFRESLLDVVVAPVGGDVADVQIVLGFLDGRSLGLLDEVVNHQTTVMEQRIVEGLLAGLSFGVQTEENKTVTTTPVALSVTRELQRDDITVTTASVMHFSLGTIFGDILDEQVATTSSSSGISGFVSGQVDSLVLDDLVVVHLQSTIGAFLGFIGQNSTTQGSVTGSVTNDSLVGGLDSQVVFQIVFVDFFMEISQIQNVLLGTLSQSGRISTVHLEILN
mmetsp:Transcript_59531/g.67720  ORF Transcript_59531/g.67720 Transcript_59531/m.67720 type:complete len:769 (+) Transcript_59531:32-2338(+)